MLSQKRMRLWYPNQVVDARADPGMKSMSKLKRKSKKIEDVGDKIKKRKHFEREYSPGLSSESEENEDVDILDVDFLCDEGPSGGSSRTTSPRDSGCEENITTKKGRRHKSKPKKRVEGSFPEISEFICPEYWKKETICCGTIFRGLCGEVMVGCFIPCSSRLAKWKLPRNQVKAEAEVAENNVTKLSSDGSSDSGYEESSNQGTIIGDSAFKKEQISLDVLNSQM